MAKGLIILLWVFLIAMLFQNTYVEEKASPIGENYGIKRVKRGYAILLFLLPFIFVAFRTEFGDTSSYYWGFQHIKIDSGLSSYLAERGKDELFYALEFFFKKYISSDGQVFLATLALIESILMIHTLRKYSENLGMSIYIFVSSAMVFNWMCNGIRQFLTVTILFALVDLILKNKWNIFIPIVLVLSGIKPIFNMFHWGTPFWLFCGIHQSSLLVIPIYFIVRGKVLTKKVWILLLALLAIAALGLLDSFLEASTENTMYADEMELITNAKGANPIRLLVSLVPIVLVLIKRNEIVADSTPLIIRLSVNMSFVTSTLYLASVFTSGTFVGRLPVYCELYNLILIPWLINHLYEKDKHILTPSLYGFYLLYYLYQLFVSWGGYVFTVKIFGLTF